MDIGFGMLPTGWAAVDFAVDFAAGRMFAKHFDKSKPYWILHPA